LVIDLVIPTSNFLEKGHLFNIKNKSNNHLTEDTICPIIEHILNKINSLYNTQFGSEKQNDHYLYHSNSLFNSSQPNDK